MGSDRDTFQNIKIFISVEFVKYESPRIPTPSGTGQKALPRSFPIPPPERNLYGSVLSEILGSEHGHNFQNIKIVTSFDFEMDTFFRISILLILNSKCETPRNPTPSPTG